MTCRLTMLLLLALLGLCPAKMRAASEAIWIEGEDFTSAAPGLERKEWKGTSLSKEAWVNMILSAEEMEKKVPEDGSPLTYDFSVNSAGTYEVWNRIGYTGARAPLRWRIDQGAWQDLSAQAPGQDHMELVMFCDVSWIKMGASALTAGKHTLEIRILRSYKVTEGKKLPDRVIYGSDAICLSPAPFHPNGKFRPGEAWQSEKDQQAAAQVFDLPAATAGQRASVTLSGLWQMARYDELEIQDRTGPVKALPPETDLNWSSIRVPSDRNLSRPDQIFAHRFICRTKVQVPADLSGRAFVLDLPLYSFAVSVFVNGQFCGFESTAFAPSSFEITKALKTGAVNEIAVVIKDFYYASDTMTPQGFATPLGVMRDNQRCTFGYDFPVGLKTDAGLLAPPILTACGAAYTTDVFAKPSLRKKELGLEITLRNASNKAVKLSLENAVEPLSGGPAEKIFTAKAVDLAAGQELVLDLHESWVNPRLWWPDDPQQYIVVTTLKQDGKVLDATRTKFGFREWEWSGRSFKLNGIPWQGWADMTYHNGVPGHATEAQLAEIAATWHRTGQTMIRREPQHMTVWSGMTDQESYDFFDRIGMPTRASGIFVGDFGSFRLVDQIKDAAGKEIHVARKPLFDNWRHQMQPWIRSLRNHPSIFIWSIEDEITFINSRLRGDSKVVEPEIRKGAEMVMALDPTRPAMVDGGDALYDQSLPVNGGHYNETDFRDYPDEAYTYEHLLQIENIRTPWKMREDCPYILGEGLYWRGCAPSAFAGLAGEGAFSGWTEADPGIAKFLRMMCEGYRWSGWCSPQYWGVMPETAEYYKTWKPVVALCRQWNWSFGGGSAVERTLKVINSTHYDDPIELNWQFVVNDKVVQKGSQTCKVAPGLGQELSVTLQMPKVSRRTSGQFILACSRKGAEVWRDEKPLWILPADAGAKPKLKAGQLWVWDPVGTVKARLKARGIDFNETDGLAKVPPNARVLIVGKDAINSEALSTSPQWLALATRGTRLVVLEQEHPLHYQAVPADFEVGRGLVGRIAFLQNLEHPISAGLDQPDFFTWSKDHIVYKNPYRKATTGARSLVQCDTELGCSALAECTTGESVMLLCQLVVGEKLGFDPVVQRLFDNLLAYAVSYAPMRRSSAVAIAPDSARGQLLATSGLAFDPAKDALAEVVAGKHDIVIADADTKNLKALANSVDQVRAFAEKGGWLFLWGLTPEGLADFNRLVGVDHLIRPFELEKVALAPVSDPLTAGLSTRDVVMGSGQGVGANKGDTFAADDEFTYIVDTGDVAPFATWPEGEYFKQPGAKPRSDHYPRNMVNGFGVSDWWQYSFSILLFKNEPTTWSIEFPRQETIEQFSIQPNATYHQLTQVNLRFEDDPAPVTLSFKVGSERHDLAVTPPRACRKLSIELAQWEKTGKLDVIGIDNIWIKAKRPADFYQKVKPMLNIGGLVRYPMGKGGIVLCQLSIPEREKVPVNAEKKKNIVSTILRNLGAVYAGGPTVVAGVGLEYDPVPLENKCNQYLTSGHGWFNDERNLAHLPVGEQVFEGVRYQIRDFKTSPAPGCIMLATQNCRDQMPDKVEGIPVNKRADALFFLHTWNAHGQIEWDSRGHPQRPVLFKYVVHYADGQTAEVPVLQGLGVDNWFVKEPKSLSQAAVVWSAPFPNAKVAGEQAVVYQFQWNNPRPDVAIQSIDVTYDAKDKNEFGGAVVLAITAARTLPTAANK